MNDDRLDALLRAAQPRQATDDLGDLRMVEHQLMEGIMKLPATENDLAETEFDTEQVVTAVVGRRRRTLVVLAAAAAVVAAVAVPTWWAGRDQPASVVPGAGELGGDYVVVDLPGWRTTMRSESNGYQDTRYAKGSQSVEINRGPAKDHQGYVDDREAGDMETSTASALGQEGPLYTYGENERYELILPPVQGLFMYIDVEGASRADALDILAALKYADRTTWEKQLPDDFVTPGAEVETAQQMLIGVPLPKGLTAKKLAEGYDRDYYQFGAHVAGQVACGWIKDWIDAGRDGDKAERKQAAQALASSHDWSVLLKMNPDGDYPEVLWELADAVNGSHVLYGGPDGPTVESAYRDALGC
ncbi:hypothetical protein ACIB24_01765 [Spongisporangium articulatum]|uniref:Uncharacterized protein n=1 Tax=Spongisporangium articulatum TaxID=3362603 RepID=A0ABW8AHZ5_9ACTN